MPLSVYFHAMGWTKSISRHLNHEQNEHSGSRCQGGAHTGRWLMRRGDGQDQVTSITTLQLGSYEPLTYKWMTLITTRLPQMGLWGIGGQGYIYCSIELLLWKAHHLNTQVKIRRLETHSLHLQKPTWKSSGWVFAVMSWANLPLCQINVALLRGPLVDYLLAGVWMG